MVQEVTKYVTDCGMMFNTEEEALGYEQDQQMRDVVAKALYACDSLYIGWSDCVEVASVVCSTFKVDAKPQ